MTTSKRPGGAILGRPLGSATVGTGEGFVAGALVCVLLPAMIWTGLVWIGAALLGADASDELLATVGVGAGLLGGIAWAGLRSGR